MPDSNVSSCVLNILGSFSSSLGLYKKVKEQRRKLRKSRKHEKVEGEEELRLSRSLRQGPEDISLEYQKSLWAVGDQFAIGDGEYPEEMECVGVHANAMYSYRTNISCRSPAQAECRSSGHCHFLRTQ